MAHSGWANGESVDVGLTVGGDSPLGKARWESPVCGVYAQRPLTQKRTPQWTPADTQPHAVTLGRGRTPDQKAFRPSFFFSFASFTQVLNRWCSALGASRKCTSFPFIPCVSPHCGCPCAHSDSRTRAMSQEQNSVHPYPPYFHQLLRRRSGTRRQLTQARLAEAYEFAGRVEAIT